MYCFLQKHFCLLRKALCSAIMSQLFLFSLLPFLFSSLITSFPPSHPPPSSLPPHYRVHSSQGVQGHPNLPLHQTALLSLTFKALFVSLLAVITGCSDRHCARGRLLAPPAAVHSRSAHSLHLLHKGISTISVLMTRCEALNVELICIQASGARVPASSPGKPGPIPLQGTLVGLRSALPI